MIESSSAAPSPTTTKAPISQIQIGAKEVQRLRERYLTRVTAVLYARVAFLLLGLGIIVIPSWRRTFAADGVLPYVVLACGCAWTYFCQRMAAHPLHGRRIMFVTLILDLVVLVAMLTQSGGFLSPAIGAQLLFVIFFALLFPNPIALLPPLMVLPVVIVTTQIVNHGTTSFSEAIMRLFWIGTLNFVAVYVMVFLTSREEKQTREILELERSLKGMAIIEERNRIARDIHDGLGASLSGVIIQAEYLLTLTKKDADLQSEVKELKTGAEEAIDEVRRAVSMWRDDFNLVPQLENMCTTFTSRHKIPVELKLSGEGFKMHESQELGIFRILQECLTNIAKHARATKVDVAVNFAPDNLTLSIVDNGAGFDPQKTPKNHYGLINMRERAKKAQGEVTIDSAPGQGTRVLLSVKPTAAIVRAA